MISDFQKFRLGKQPHKEFNDHSTAKDGERLGDFPNYTTFFFKINFPTLTNFDRLLITSSNHGLSTQVLSLHTNLIIFFLMISVAASALELQRNTASGSGIIGRSMNEYVIPSSNSFWTLVLFVCCVSERACVSVEWGCHGD